MLKINKILPLNTESDFIVQTQFSNLTRSQVKLSYNKLFKSEDVHYNIRLKNDDGSFSSLSIFLDEPENFDSGKMFIKKNSSNVWHQTTAEKYFIAQVGDKDEFIKIYNLDEGKFFIKNQSEGSITFVFAGKLFNGTYIAKRNGKHYDFKKQVEINLVEKMARTQEETTIFAKKYKDSIYKEMAEIVKEDIALGSYSLEEAIETFPQLKDNLIKNEIPEEQKQPDSQELSQKENGVDNSEPKAE